MSITIINVERAVSIFETLCAHYFVDSEIDVIAPTILAKQFDNLLDEAVDDWMLKNPEELKNNLKELIEEDPDNLIHVAIHELLYDIYNDFGHLGLLVRVVLLDGNGNILVQTEDIDNDSRRFQLNRKNGFFRHPRHRDIRN